MMSIVAVGVGLVSLTVVVESNSQQAVFFLFAGLLAVLRFQIRAQIVLGEQLQPDATHCLDIALFMHKQQICEPDTIQSMADTLTSALYYMSCTIAGEAIQVS
jgi:hypothetical protein